MDPQQRQLLERGYVALRTSGASKASLLGSVIGVSVGQWASEFGSVLARTPAGSSVYASTGFSCSVTCGLMRHCCPRPLPSPPPAFAAPLGLCRPHPTIREMSSDGVAAYREQLNVRCSGFDVPAPIKRFEHANGTDGEDEPYPKVEGVFRVQDRKRVPSATTTVFRAGAKFMLSLRRNRR